MTRTTRILFLMTVAALALAGCASPPKPVPEALVRGERYLEQGVQAYQGDDFTTAAAYFNKSLVHFQGLDLRDGILRSRINLAETALAVGNLAAAETQLDAALVLAEEEKRDEYLRRVRLLRSSAALRRQHFDDAVGLLEPLLNDGSATDDIMRNALANRVNAALGRPADDPAQWVEKFAQSLRGSDDPRLAARLLRFRAELLRRAGDAAGAEQLLQQALDTYKAIPYRSGTAGTLEQWGELLAGGQRWDDAEDRWRRALYVRLWLLDRGGTAADLKQLAQANTAAGRTQRADIFTHWAELVASPAPVDWAALKQEVLPY